MAWTAEITNDPEHDFELHIELLEDEQYRGRVVRDGEGWMQLQVYGGTPVAMPWDWLTGVVERFRSEHLVEHAESEE